MRRYPFRLAVLLGLFFSAIVSGGEPEKVGIVKGLITIGGKPTADAIVSVEGLPEENLKSQLADQKSKKVLIDQRDMKFVPRVLPVVIGTTVDFPNHDKTFHNVFSTSEARKFDLGLYPPGKNRSATFDKTGVVKILCNVHPDMEAFIVVVGHTYFSATDKRGNYQVKSLPLGKYRLQVWHPDFETQVLPFELVREGEVLGMDLDLKK